MSGFMSGFMRFFFGQAQIKCSLLPEGDFCHKHSNIKKWEIITWSWITTIVATILGFFISWASNIGYNKVFQVSTLEEASKWLNSFWTDTGIFPYIAILTIFLLLLLFNLFVCRRKYISIGEYVITAASTPVAVLALFSPIF